GLPEVIAELTRTLRAVSDLVARLDGLDETLVTQRTAMVATLDQHAATLTTFVAAQRAAAIEDARRTLDAAVDRPAIGIALVMLVGWVVTLASIVLYFRMRSASPVRSS